MLIRDESVKARHETADPIVQHKEQVEEWVLNELSARRVVENWDESPANFLRQWGTPMHARELEKKLLQLSPYLGFEFNPRRGKMELFHILPDSTRNSMGFYEPDWMPEYSLFNVREKWTPAEGVNRITRKEVEESNGHAGFKKVVEPWNEVIRGWRTVVAKVVIARLTTPDAAERLFGTSNRATWAAKMGKAAPSWV